MWSSFILLLSLFVSLFENLSATTTSQEKSVTPQYLDNLLNTNKLEEFMTLLQIPYKDLVDPSQRKNDALQAIALNGLNHTDMLMRPGQVLNEAEKLYIDGIINLKINTWEDGIIPYYLSKAYSTNETRFLKHYIKITNRKFGPNIKLRPYEDGEADYLFIFPGGCGCYSNLGYVGGPQVMSLPPVCLLDGFFLHEIHHVFGIGHESNRFDRDDYIRLRPENIPQVITSQIIRYNAETPVNVGPFDYYSIMGIPFRVLKLGDKMYDVLQDGIDESKVGIDNMLSPLDIQRVKTIYKNN